ncbi:flagellar hook-length control protein FliK [Thalassotalea atypica]|uniref:flagellar hook-length control protein FliK n=1 Tax=Thalassotalea atypica TaxID=2054316 RepID=UPI002572E55B|nr:flagellar hook-length control protein FliK [Thalassotalea atypica]
MSQVKLLAVDLTQAVESKHENPVPAGAEKNAGAFAELVDKQMSRDANGNDSRAFSGKSGKELSTEQHGNNSSQVKQSTLKNAEQALNEAAERQQSAVANTQVKGKSADSPLRDESYSEKTELGSVEQALPDQQTVDDNTENVDESQALLNLLSASNGMLTPFSPEHISTGGTGSEVSADYVGPEDEKLSLEQANKISLKEELNQLKKLHSDAQIGDKSVTSNADKLANAAAAQQLTEDAKVDDNIVSKASQTSLTEQESDREASEGKRAAKGAITSIEQLALSTKKGAAKPISPELLSKIQQSTDEVLSEQQLNELANKLNLNSKAKDLLMNQPGSPQTKNVLSAMESEVSTNKSGNTDKTLDKSISAEKMLAAQMNGIAQSQAEAVESKNGEQQIAQVALAKQMDKSSIKVPNNLVSSIKGSNALPQADANLSQSAGAFEQSNKEHSSEAKSELINQQLQLETNEEMALKPDKAISKSMVAETLQHTGGLINSARLDAEQIEDSANEHLVEQLTNRVVKENQQVQKTQLATDTIAIYKKEFANEVKEKVMVMINQKLQQVDIQLDPPELGNMHVRVNLQNEQASVSFMVQNQQAKEALEQHMNKLREMLSESGVDVGDANIEHRNASSGNGESEAGEGHFSDGETDDDAAQVATLAANVVKASAVGVDFYA